MEVNRLLLGCGADINETNFVRKHLSSVKGGRLLNHVGRRPLLTLILSDVTGDPPDVIASGPTVPDALTFQDAWGVLEKYGLTGKVPEAVFHYLRAGMAGEKPETLKRTGDQEPGNHKTVVFGNSRILCESAADKARSLGYEPLILSAEITGDVGDCVEYHRRRLQKAIGEDGLRRSLCVISGGETTVKVTGDGLGGRNQEFALRWVPILSGMEKPIVVASVGTDGTDGPTDAAGAMADNDSRRRALAISLDPDEYLRRNDSYHFFKALDDLVVTGPTGTNVMDLRLLIC